MLGGISVWQLLIVLGIIILIFGTKKLRNLGGDLGSAVKGFKESVNHTDGDNQEKESSIEKKEPGHILENTAEKTEQKK